MISQDELHAHEVEGINGFTCPNQGCGRILQTAYTYRHHLTCCLHRQWVEMDDSLCGRDGCSKARAHPGLCQPATLSGRRPSRPTSHFEVPTVSDHPRGPAANRSRIATRERRAANGWRPDPADPLAHHLRERWNGIANRVRSAMVREHAIMDGRAFDAMLTAAEQAHLLDYSSMLSHRATCCAGLPGGGGCPRKIHAIELDHEANVIDSLVELADARAQSFLAQLR